MKTILVLHTGGTISMSKVAGGSVAPNKKSVDGTRSIIFWQGSFSCRRYFNIPHTHDLRTDVSIKRTDSKAYSEPIDGVVITHGTDTLEETAYF